MGISCQVREQLGNTHTTTSPKSNTTTFLRSNHSLDPKGQVLSMLVPHLVVKIPYTRSSIGRESKRPGTSEKKNTVQVEQLLTKLTMTPTTYSIILVDTYYLPYLVCRRPRNEKPWCQYLISPNKSKAASGIQHKGRNWSGWKKGWSRSKLWVALRWDTVVADGIQIQNLLWITISLNFFEKL